MNDLHDKILDAINLNDSLVQFDKDTIENCILPEHYQDLSKEIFLIVVEYLIQVTSTIDADPPNMPLSTNHTEYWQQIKNRYETK